MHWNDKEYKWKNKDRAFANMIIQFKVRALVPLEYGSKITGRLVNSNQDVLKPRENGEPLK